MLNEFICIGLICFAVKSFYDAYTDPNKHIDLDHFPILEYSPAKRKYVPASQQTVCQIKDLKIKQKEKESLPKKEEHRNSNGYTQLQQDCFDALAALGVKTKKERTFIVNNTFNQHNPKTVQEFLQLALIRAS
jgi:hypothetical protein